MATITVEEFEQKVWETENIRITIRASENTKVNDYEYQNAAQGNWSTKKWLDSRVLPCLNGNSVVVIQGNGEEPNGKTLVRNVKSTYHTGL